MLVQTDQLSAQPSFDEGNATKEKIEYCNRLVNKFGHKSQEINDKFYGIGVQRPKKDQWEMSIMKRGWFSTKELFLRYDQITQEKYDYYDHRVYCKWSHDDYFEFVIKHFMYDIGPYCTNWGDRQCPKY